MRHAEEIRRGLEASAGAAVIDNYDLLQSFLAYGSIGVGSATSAWGRHLDEVAGTLEEIERLHQRLKGGALDRTEFARQRQALFGRLDAQLQGAARFGTGMRGNQSLKKVLGISTRSYLHNGEIAGYAQRVRGDCAGVEVVGERGLRGLGVGCWGHRVGDQGGVCDGAGGAVQAGKVCGDGKAGRWRFGRGWGRVFGR